MVGAVFTDPAAVPRPRLEKAQGGCLPEARISCVAVGAVPVLSKEATSGKKGHRFGQVKTPHNPLDSSAPLVKKGKQREVPKAKKPTSLKKVSGAAFEPGTGEPAVGLPPSPEDMSTFSEKGKMSWGVRSGWPRLLEREAVCLILTRGNA